MKLVVKSMFMASAMLVVAAASGCGGDGIDESLVWGDPVEESVYGDMVSIPAGSFGMGCDEADAQGCAVDEGPKHTVTLSAYAMDKTEVTRLAYRDCVEAGKCGNPACNWDPVVNPNSPVVCVSWQQAFDFCKWAGKRLPTEAEWEMAARGTDGRKYPWGNDAANCTRAVMEGTDGTDCGEETDSSICIGCGTGSSMKVCGKSPAGDSPFGLCDMAGNAWEWVADWYGDYGADAVTNPKGPSSGEFHVSRGGGLYDVAGTVRTTNRYDTDRAVENGFDSGFRCATDPQN